MKNPKNKHSPKPVSPFSALVAVLLSAPFLYGFIISSITDTHVREDVEAPVTRLSQPLPPGFAEKVAGAEARYRLPWLEFDRENRASCFYFGLLRGQAAGEFKAAVDKEGRMMHSILILYYGPDHFAFSRPAASRLSGKPGKREFLIRDSGRGYYGKFGSLVKGEIFGERASFLKGGYRFSLGIYGLASGKFFGIRTGPGGWGPGPLSIHNRRLIRMLKGQMKQSAE